MKIELTMIRHGKTKLNEENRYIGCKTDISLSELGRKEIEEKAAAGYYTMEPEILFCSPMKRCLETADIIFPGREKIVIDELYEIDFGLFEGKNYSELNGTPSYQEWIDSGGKKVFPEGESIDHYCERVMKGIERIKHIIDENIMLNHTDNSAENNNSVSKRISEVGDINRVVSIHENCGQDEENKTVRDCYNDEERVFCAALVCHGGTIMAARSVIEGREYYDKMLKNGESCLVEI